MFSMFFDKKVFSEVETENGQWYYQKVKLTVYETTHCHTVHK
jgi:hypothetical protein